MTSAATGQVAFSPLTARLANVASSRDGSAAFTFEVWFSEEFPLSYKTPKFHAFEVTGGTISKSQRIDKPSNIPQIHHLTIKRASVTLVVGWMGVS